MMNIDRKMIEDYVMAYADVNCFGLGFDGLIKNWKQAKEKRLFNLFKGELIIEKQINVDKPAREIEREIEKFVDNSDFYFKFRHILENMFLKGTIGLHTMFTIRSLIDNETLSKGKTWHGFKIEIGSKKLVISEGQKAMKAIKRVIDSFDEFEECLDLFEVFRQKHSIIINGKKAKGTLCLSIHPMDYMTMSDNENDWLSCMSWRDAGCYQAGTLEMMNCSYTIVAYLKSSSKTLDFSNHKWNSKIWRTLVHVSDDMIISNKNYPYQSSELTTEVINWIKELNKEVEYSKNIIEVDLDDYSYRLPVTELMYNDFDAEGFSPLLLVREGVDEFNAARIFIGGQAFCLECGCPIEDRSNSLRCNDCDGLIQCDYCGDHEDASESVIVTMSDGSEATLCYYCARNHSEQCVKCGVHYDAGLVGEDGVCEICSKKILEAKEDKETSETLLSLQPVQCLKIDN